MKAISRATRWGLAIAGFQALVAILVAVVPASDSGLAGGLLYGVMYALPTAVIAVAWGSATRWERTSAAWAALLSAAFYTAIPILNWSGYTEAQALFVGVITVPTVVFDLAVFSLYVAVAVPGLSPASALPGRGFRRLKRPRPYTPRERDVKGPARTPAPGPGAMTGHEGSTGSTAQGMKRYKRSL